MEKSPGFTLVDLLMALFVICILSALAVPSYQYFVNEQKLKSIQATLVELQNQQQMNRLSNSMPTDNLQLELQQSGYQISAESTANDTYKFVATNDDGVPGCERLSIDGHFNKMPDECWH